MTDNGLWTSLRRAADVLRRIIGVPDYDRYVAHVQQCHAGTVPMTRAEFEKTRLDDKYSRPGQRCC
ncbi:MAG: YbdD/YjiX family protein [Gemmatimonadota bacterium]